MVFHGFIRHPAGNLFTWINLSKLRNSVSSLITFKNKSLNKTKEIPVRLDLIALHHSSESSKLLLGF